MTWVGDGGLRAPRPHHHGKSEVVCKAPTELVTSSVSLVPRPPPPCLTGILLPGPAQVSPPSSLSEPLAAPPARDSAGLPPFCLLLSSSAVSL